MKSCLSRRNMGKQNTDLCTKGHRKTVQEGPRNNTTHHIICFVLMEWRMPNLRNMTSDKNLAIYRVTRLAVHKFETWDAHSRKQCSCLVSTEVGGGGERKDVAVCATYRVFPWRYEGEARKPPLDTDLFQPVLMLSATLKCCYPYRICFYLLIGMLIRRDYWWCIIIQGGCHCNLCLQS
jgi:hypothetical protein